MTTSQAGLDLIARFEGLRLKAYQDGAGVWTIGFGHTGGVTPQQYETEEQANADLATDVAGAERGVSSLVQIPLTQGQFDALVSFTFNEGTGRLKTSTLLRLLNAGQYILAAQQFTRWDIVAGQTSQGLLTRRIAEQAMFTGSA